jgi:hypothetical protein
MCINFTAISYVHLFIRQFTTKELNLNLELTIRNSNLIAFYFFLFSFECVLLSLSYMHIFPLYLKTVVLLIEWILKIIFGSGWIDDSLAYTTVRECEWWSWLFLRLSRDVINQMDITWPVILQTNMQEEIFLMNSCINNYCL